MAVLFRRPLLLVRQTRESGRVFVLFYQWLCGLISIIVNTGNSFKLDKRSQLFIRSHNETLSVFSMALCQKKQWNELRGAKINGDSIWRGAYKSARSPITASPHRGVLAVAA